jgi:hypothetical protein
MVGLGVGAAETAGVAFSLLGYYWVAILVPTSAGLNLSAQIFETEEKAWGCWMVHDTPLTAIPMDEEQRLMPVRIPFEEFGKPSTGVGEELGLPITEEIRVNCPNPKCDYNKTKFRVDYGEITHKLPYLQFKTFPYVVTPNPGSAPFEKAVIISPCEIDSLRQIRDLIFFKGFPVMARTTFVSLTRVLELDETIPTFGAPCVTGDTIILGDNKRIENSEIGDQHIGLNGLGKINKVFRREYSGEMVHVRGMGLLPFNVTPEHPILTMRYTRPTKGLTNGRWNKWVSSLGYRPAKDLIPRQTINGKTQTYDCLVMRIPRARTTFVRKYLDLAPFAKNEAGYHRAISKGMPPRLPLNTDTAWMMGLYVAEGSSHLHGPVFTLGAHEVELQEKLGRIIRGLGLSVYFDNRPDVHATNAVLECRAIGRAFKTWCGNHAENKQVPDFILFHRSRKIVRAFLEGYVDGDAHKNGHEGRYDQATTVSRTLALQIQLIALRLGLFATISTREAHVVELWGKKVSERESYLLEIRKEPYYEERCKVRRRYLKTFSQGPYRNLALTPVTEISKANYVGPVYNLETSDNTYLVNNAIVHNCYVVSHSSWHVKIAQQLAGFTPAYMVPTQEQIGSVYNMWGITEAMKLQQQNEILKQRISSLESGLPDFRKAVQAGIAHERKLEELIGETRREVKSRLLQPKFLAMLAVAIISVIIITYLLTQFVFK